MAGKTPIFIQILRELKDPPQATGVVGTLNCCDFISFWYSEQYVLFWDLKDDILFLPCLFACTFPVVLQVHFLHVCYVFNVMDSFLMTERFQCRFDIMIVVSHRQ